MDDYEKSENPVLFSSRTSFSPEIEFGPVSIYLQHWSGHLFIYAYF